MKEIYYSLHRKFFKITNPLLYLYLKKKNPIMRVEINGQIIKVPFNHSGPLYQKEFEKYDRQLGKICKNVFDKLNGISVIDIGANIGDTSVNIGLKEAEYLAVEGDKEFFALLEENTQNYSVHYENVFLSDNEKRGYRNVITSGTGALVEDDNSEVNIITLDKLMQMKYSDFKADIIKIDTDGFDFKVIRGGRDYIRNTKAVIFFEWDKEKLNEQREDELSIFQELGDMGYEDLIIFDNFGNKMVSVKLTDTKLLRDMAEYSMSKDKRIDYYDVLAIHKDSPVSASDFECL